MTGGGVTVPVSIGPSPLSGAPPAHTDLARPFAAVQSAPLQSNDMLPTRTSQRLVVELHHMDMVSPPPGHRVVETCTFSSDEVDSLEEPHATAEERASAASSRLRRRDWPNGP